MCFTWGVRNVQHPDDAVDVLARQRQTLILERVREDGGGPVADLARELGVSDMTVRRDLELLHDRGLLEEGPRRGHGPSRQRAVRAGLRGQVGASRSPRRTRSPRRRSAW